MNLIYEHEVLGAVYSTLPDGYAGTCEMVVERNSGKEDKAVFPTPNEALSAAKFAVGAYGGYPKAVLNETKMSVTHESWQDWALA